MNILLVKPYQASNLYTVSPPLGILLLTSLLRAELGDRVSVRVVDARLQKRTAESLRVELEWADLVGLSALNVEAAECDRAARLVKTIDPGKLVVLGGPYAHNRAREILARCEAIDWVFEGEADRSFPEAMKRTLDGRCLGFDILGLYRRDAGGKVLAPPANDHVSDLDSLPIPAWDLVDFDAYAAAPSMNAWLKGTRYGALFTTRGCPYHCIYCHSIFSKQLRSQSPERVLREIDLLVEKHGVDELQIFDDAFNLNKDRAIRVLKLVAERANPLHICFPNGLRADKLDEELLDAMKRAGTYQVTLAIETASPRLQKLLRKNLDLDKIESIIDSCTTRGILAKGFFMLGFPSETKAEIWRTIRFAWSSRLTFASFFTVVPQPETQLYDLAAAHQTGALSGTDEGNYYTNLGWYERAFGFPVHLVARLGLTVFFLHPGRLSRILRQVGPRRIGHGLSLGLSVLFSSDPERGGRRRSLRKTIRSIGGRRGKKSHPGA